MDNFLSRKKAVDKCAQVTKSRGWKVFAIQDGGWCASSPTAHLTYNKYGTADNCVSGKGGMFANDVYIIDGKKCTGDNYRKILPYRNVIDKKLKMRESQWYARKAL